MSNMKKTVAVVLSALLLALGFTGCQVQLENDDTDTVAAVFEDQKIYMNEAKLYVYTTQRQMEYSNQFMVLYYYGSYQSFWDANWAYNLTQAMQEVYQTKLLVKLAEENGVALTADELAEVERQKEKFKTDAAKSIEYAGATDELVDLFLRENALAVKYYLKLVEDVDRNFDEETFHRKSATGVSITAKSTKPAPTEEEPTDEEEAAPEEEAEEGEEEAEAAEEVEAAEADNDAAEDEANEEAAEEENEAEAEDESEGDVEGDPEGEDEPTEEESTEEETYSDEEKEENVRKATEDIRKLIAGGLSASEVVAMYAEDETVNVSTLGDVETSKENAKSEDATEDPAATEPSYKNYQELAWELATDETRSTTIVNDSGNLVGYVVHCENDDDPELRKKAEDEELEKRKAALFASRITDLMKKHSTFHVYQEKVAGIRYKGSILDSITVTGDDYAEHEDELNQEDETGEEPADEDPGAAEE